MNATLACTASEGLHVNQLIRCLLLYMNHQNRQYEQDDQLLETSLLELDCLDEVLSDLLLGHVVLLLLFDGSLEHLHFDVSPCGLIDGLSFPPYSLQNRY